LVCFGLLSEREDPDGIGRLRSPSRLTMPSPRGFEAWPSGHLKHIRDETSSSGNGWESTGCQKRGGGFVSPPPRGWEMAVRGHRPVSSGSTWSGRGCTSPGPSACASAPMPRRPSSSAPGAPIAARPGADGREPGNPGGGRGGAVCLDPPTHNRGKGGSTPPSLSCTQSSAGARDPPIDPRTTIPLISVCVDHPI